MVESLRELRDLSDDELIRRYDAAAPHTGVGTAHYLDEFRHREIARQTRTLVMLTVFIAILTVANVAAS